MLAEILGLKELKQSDMKSIKEKAKEYTNGFHPSIQRMCNESFVDGANYVLDAIEEFMTTMNLGSNAAEKFYKLDLMADIHGFIEQLKSNQ